MIFLSDTRQNCLGKFELLEDLKIYIDSLLADKEYVIDDNKVKVFNNNTWIDVYKIVFIKD